jgi:HlyD family secretion protein
MKRIVIIVVIMAIAVGLSFLVYRSLTGNRSSPLGEVQFVTVERGSIVETVNASGAVEPAAKAALTFKVSAMSPGTVAEILVEEGDRVEAGQVLVRLDTAELELAVEQAKAALAISEAQLQRLQNGARAEDVAAAQAALDAAVGNLASAEAGLTSAEASQAKVVAGASERDIELARLGWEQAKDALWAAQANRDATKGNPLNPGYVLDGAEAAVLQAEIAVRMARLQYEMTVDGPTQEDLDTAQAFVDQAQGQVKAARAQVDQAQAALDRLKAGAAPEELAIARAQVVQAKAAMMLAEMRLQDASIVAPFTGTVAHVAVEVGELVSSAMPAIMLVDPSRYHIDVRVDETDIARVEVGQQVRIALDAFPGEELAGRVARISPAGTAFQGIVSYGVAVEMAATERHIRPDMTANADISVESKEGVLLIPNRAIRRDRQGKFVELSAAGELQKVYVETGLTDGAYTEVVVGLQEAQTVVVKTQQQRAYEELREIMGP